MFFALNQAASLLTEAALYPFINLKYLLKKASFIIEKAPDTILYSKKKNIKNNVILLAKYV